MAKHKDYRACILLMIVVVWLLFIIAGERNYRLFNDVQSGADTWDIGKLTIEGRGAEDTDSLREIFELKAIPVNRAGEQLLITVPGIGPELARRIVDQRSRSGRFNAPEELTKVSGIGPRRAEQFKHYLSFD
jgi:DNA uptake protein ComE-like DNA-binding protein